MIAELMEKMIAFSAGDIHDIDHLIRVWSYAKTIGELEGLDENRQLILEAAAITHDIACPLCRRKYGNTNGKYQEEEGAVMVRGFLADTTMKAFQTDRVAFLVGHHHTLTDIDGTDWQILVEADFIANASESGYEREKIRDFLNNTAKTASGKKLTRDVFRL
ncbi:MAG: HD domain-containing protein [Oscillospiraceae bacterium]|nr:HD domain-containing protein [Oscillospiraceae bacterium]